MKIVCVVVGSPTQISHLYRHHEKLLNATKRNRQVLILANGMEVHYLTKAQYERWLVGRTYIFLEDYIMEHDIFFHSGKPITKEQLRGFLSGTNNEKEVKNNA